MAQIEAWTELMDSAMERGQRRALSDLAEIVAAKRGDIHDELGGEVEPPGLRGSPCFVQAGTVTVEFTTTYGSYPSGDLYSGGEAETYYELGDVVYPSIEDGVSIGEYTTDKLLWITISEVSDGVYLAPYVIFDASLLEDGADIPLDGYSAEAALLYSSPETGGQWANAAYLGDGTLHLSVASDEDGAEVSGTLDVLVLTSGG